MSARDIEDIKKMIDHYRFEMSARDMYKQFLNMGDVLGRVEVDSYKEYRELLFPWTFKFMHGLDLVLPEEMAVRNKENDKKLAVLGSSEFLEGVDTDINKVLDDYGSRIVDLSQGLSSNVSGELADSISYIKETNSISIVSSSPYWYRANPAILFSYLYYEDEMLNEIDKVSIKRLENIMGSE